MSPPMGVLASSAASVSAPATMPSLCSSPSFLNTLDQYIFNDNLNSFHYNNQTTATSQSCHLDLDNSYLFNSSCSPTSSSGQYNSSNTSDLYSPNELFDFDLNNFFNFQSNPSEPNPSESLSLFPSLEDFNDESNEDDTDDDLLNSETQQALAAVINSDLINNTENSIEENISNDLIAIRDIAIRERRQQQRKHKISTSSTSSQSMRSTIKKFAIDLQNTTTQQSSEAQNSQPAVDLFLPNDLPLDINDLDQNEFNDFLELEGWEQMLDEDCISRLTAEFNTNCLETTNTPKSEQSGSNNLKLPTQLKLPTTTVLSSSSTVPKVQSLSSASSGISKPQPLVVLLSSKSSTASPVNLKTTNIVSTIKQERKQNAKPSTSPNTSTSLIDYCEVIDCINPEQIFPYRLPCRQVKTDTEIEENTKSMVKVMDESDEEEIDVVSVNNLSTGPQSANVHMNLNHHNYYNSSTSNNKKAQNQTSKTDSSSLLAKCLKSSSTSLNCKTSVTPSAASGGPIQSTKAVQQNGLKTQKPQINNFLKTTKLVNPNETNVVLNGAQLLNKQKSVVISSNGSSLIKSSILQENNKLTNGTATSIRKTTTTTTTTTTTSSCTNKKNANTTGLSTAQKYSSSSSSSGSNLSSIRILTTTTANGQSSAIRQINQTQQVNRAQIAKSNSSFVLNEQSTPKFVTMTATKVATTPKTLNTTPISSSKITGPSNTSNTSKLIATTPCTNLSTISLSSVSSNQSLKIPLQTKTTGSSLTSKVTKKIPKLLNRSVSKTGQSKELYFEDEEFSRHLSAACELKQTKVMIKSSQQMSKIAHLENNFSMNSKSSIDDDDDDDDDDDEDVDDECSNSSSSSPSSTSSPSSLTSNSSSGCSTPTKNKMTTSDQFDFVTLNEKLNKKNRKNVTTNGATSKRSNRLTSLGYSSDNPAEKRAFHILSERQRRNDLKKLFETLRTNIPNLSDKQKASKLTILKAAVDHLIEVANKKEKLSSIYEKEKEKHAQLMLHLKSLQQQQQASLGVH